MSEEPGDDRSQLHSPLAADADLFYGFMGLLDEVLASGEIKTALTDQNLTANGTRMACVAAAGGVLRDCSAEYAAYVQARAAYEEVWSQVGRGESRDAADVVLRNAARALVAAGSVSALVGLAGGHSLPAVVFLWKAGLAALTVGLLSFALATLRSTDFGVRLLGDEAAGRLGAELDRSRNELLSAVGNEQLLAFVRSLINRARNDALGQEFTVSASPGLSEVHDSTFRVPTGITHEIDELIERLAGGSIGIAGPRGSGKSTLLRRYCEGSGDGSGRDLRCMVSAPVDYAARDFVLHLFATFCRAVRSQLEGRRHVRGHGSVWALAAGVRARLPRAAFCGAVGGALLAYRDGIAGVLGGRGMPVVYAAAAVFGYGLLHAALPLVHTRPWSRSAAARSERWLRALAERNLRRVRYLQTRSAGWSGGVKLSMSKAVGVEGRRTGETAWAEQPLSYPEIVEEFRVFAREVATYAHKEGDRVFIGVDELDKIGSAEQAERFLNEIKGIFGVPHTYFLVSVSDDALTSFERRGLPLRDTFDSSFDEILQVEPLVYFESRRLVHRRVIGLTEPYIVLSHCLSGGLARDLIRVARQIVRVGHALATPEKSPLIGEIGPVLVRDEIDRKLRAATRVVASLAESADTEPLLERLYTIIHLPATGRPVADLVRELATAASAQPPQIAAICRDLAAYAYFCLTIEEISGSSLDEPRLLWASAEGERHPGHFDTLATARRMFAHNTHVTWQLIDAFRDAWSLPPIADRS